MSEKSTRIQSVARAMAILELFDERTPVLSTSEIAARTGLNRATAYRFCQTLLSLGYLEESGQRSFRPGLKAVSLARAALNSHELPELALPYLQALLEKTGETVNMALLDDTEVVYVSRLHGPRLLGLRLSVGSRLPAWSSSLGRAMIAFLPEAELNDILDRSEFQKFTENTIVDREALIEQLAHIRERGYAMNSQEVSNGLWGIAAPVFAASGRPLAAINLSIPHPIDDETARDLAEETMATAKTISKLAADVGIEARLSMAG